MEAIDALFSSGQGPGEPILQLCISQMTPKKVCFESVVGFSDINPLVILSTFWGQIYFNPRPVGWPICPPPPVVFLKEQENGGAQRRQIFSTFPGINLTTSHKMSGPRLP